MKILSFFIACILSGTLYAQQISKVMIQAGGLTCSMCSNSIYKSLKTVDFVEKVDANVQNSTFEVSFKNGGQVDLEKLRKKVEDAGFFITSFIANVQLNEQTIKPGEDILVGNNHFLFSVNKPTTVKGITRLRVINKGFVAAKEYKKKPVETSKISNTYYVTI